MKRLGQYLLLAVAGLALLAAVALSRVERLDLNAKKTGVISVSATSALDFGVYVRLTKNADGLGFSKEAWVLRVEAQPTNIHIDMFLSAASGLAGFRL